VKQGSQQTMKKIVCALAVLSLFGCAHQSQTGNAYTAGQARQAQTVQRGQVVSVKDVDVSARPSGAGTLAGGALGGIAGAGNGGYGSNKSAASAVAGMLIGGIMGNVVDKKVNTLKGQEISVVLTNGTEIAIAQEIDEKEGPFLVGEQVRLLTSGTGVTRVSR
jgi:outer membrane lipoprotein SlyB